jgi:hypothetical protein
MPDRHVERIVTQRPPPKETATRPSAPTAAATSSSGWLAATAAVGITASLILRGTAVLGDARPTVVALLVFLAVLTGMLMPMVSYLSIARDGSKVSRERDRVAADLDNDRDTCPGAAGSSRTAAPSPNAARPRRHHGPGRPC